MNKFKNSFIIALTLVFTLVISCKDLDDLNINPNGVDPETADLNLLLPTIETGVGQSVMSLGFGKIAGVMQHTQYDGWSGGHNSYDWDNSNQSWSGYYGILRNNEEFYKKAVDGEFEFHKGVALVMRSYTLGLITDLWGDAPFSEALNAEQGSEHFSPVFDAQQEIYMQILADLDTANMLLSKNSTSYKNIVPAQDVLYKGDVTKWRKFANSLALRYYMRLSAKEPGTAEDGIRRITSNPDNYPLILDASENANISYPGDSPSTSWPSNTVFDPDPSGNYMRTKMCSTFIEVLQSLNDPRLAVWANKIETPLLLVPGEEIDEIIDGVRNISQDQVDKLYSNEFEVDPDYDQEYVGIPPSFIAAPAYNINPNLEQGVFNPHASQLNDIYKKTNGDLLLMRLMSAAEVHFILSEAALYGWGPENPEDHYGAAIQQSMNAWGVGGSAANYIAGVPYSGLESIIEQKWIASWTAAAESWFDYRRTGMPDLQTGELAKRQALPIRFYYHFESEISLNYENADAAIQKLEPTEFKGSDPSNNSAWSKMWLLQGTGKPY
ncbi:MAG: SusD/RagB family nutrient-binding outer membrane lipoprotein [Draconibacterium sp.]|nr:SusD/RagB family nutrient-binding outer membrane lipoprotein [Draconibacterium sp.]